MAFNLNDEIYRRREVGWKKIRSNQYYVWFENEKQKIKMSKETGKIVEEKNKPDILGEQDP